MKYTKEQQEIIDISDKNIIVSASAGSGKTTIMIEKIYQIISSQKIPVKDILVVTFTKSAALEMKQKLSNKLSENIDDAFIQSQVDDLPTADICTVDSFCEKIVKKYFYLLGIDESFSILSAQEKADLSSRAMNNSLNAFKAKNPNDYLLLLDVLSNNRTEKKLKELIEQTYNFTSSLRDEDEFLEKSKLLYTDKHITLDFLTAFLNDEISSYVNILKFYQQKSKNLGLDKYVANINFYLSYLNNIAIPKDFCKKIDLIADKDSHSLYKDKDDGTNLKETISNTKKNCQKFLDDFAKKFGSGALIENSFESTLQIYNAFVTLYQLFKQKFSDLKTKYNCLDFADLEKYTLQLFKNESVLADIKHNYKKIFVDEFQDVNDIQFTIFDTLKQDDNIFYVGDFKQAIYGFRQSNPNLFLQTIKDFILNESCEYKSLNGNFRSDKNVLDFVNKIFNSILTTETAKIDYSQANLEGQAKYLPSYAPPVSINIIKDTKAEKEIASGIYSVEQDYLNNIKNNQSAKLQETIFIAKTISELVGKKIYDAKTESFREIGYQDIAILLRKRGDFQSLLTKTLSEYNIPCIANLRELLDESYDIKVLYSALKLTTDQFDDYLVCGVLLSPLCNLTEQELAQIKVSSSAKNFFEAIDFYRDNFSDAIAEKISKFYNLIDELSFNITYKGICLALDSLVKSTDYLLTISDSSDFATRSQNIQNYIDSFANSVYEFDLPKYISVRDTALSDTSISNISTETAKVTITTMHQSKGLEYPIVFLANLDEDFSKSPNSGEVKFNSEIGIGLKTYDKLERKKYNGVFYTTAKLKNDQDDLGEKLRLLYVATTRAKNSLYITGCKKDFDFEKNTTFNVLHAKNFLDLIIGSFSEEEIEKANNGECFDISNNSNYKYTTINQFESQTTNTTQFVDEKALSQSQTETKNSIKQYLSKRTFSEKHTVSLKNSVSKLSFDENNGSINFAPQKLTAKEDLTEYQTTEQGTFAHKIMELVDFANINTLCDFISEICKNKKELKQFDNQNDNNLQNLLEFFFNYTSSSEIPSYVSDFLSPLFKIILQIKKYISSDSKIYKEQKFVSYIPADQVSAYSFSDKIMVQGAIDLLVMSPKIILLFDYKLSSLKKERLLAKYNKQLYLYSLALQKAFKKPIKKFLVNIKLGEIYEVE